VTRGVPLRVPLLGLLFKAMVTPPVKEGVRLPFRFSAETVKPNELPATAP
jgi:hypothetical protein